MRIIKKLYWGYYGIRADGNVVRLKPGNGTWIGRVLKPYRPNPYNTDLYYSFSVKATRYQKSMKEIFHVKQR